MGMGMAVALAMHHRRWRRIPDFKTSKGTQDIFNRKQKKLGPCGSQPPHFGTKGEDGGLLNWHRSEGISERTNGDCGPTEGGGAALLVTKKKHPVGSRREGEGGRGRGRTCGLLSITA